jgi:hypothetical protein
VDTAAHQEHVDVDPDDGAVGRAVVRGITAGAVFGFVVTVLIGLLADLDLERAVEIAVWPGFVGGPFFGGVVAVGRFMLREERRELARQRARAGSPARPSHPAAA